MDEINMCGREQGRKEDSRMGLGPRGLCLTLLEMLFTGSPGRRGSGGRVEMPGRGLSDAHGGGRSCGSVSGVSVRAQSPHFPLPVPPAAHTAEFLFVLPRLLSTE